MAATRRYADGDAPVLDAGGLESLPWWGQVPPEIQEQIAALAAPYMGGGGEAMPADPQMMREAKKQYAAFSESAKKHAGSEQDFCRRFVQYEKLNAGKPTANVPSNRNPK